MFWTMVKLSKVVGGNTLKLQTLMLTGSRSYFIYVNFDEKFIPLKFDQQDAEGTLNAEWLILNGA